MRKKIILVLLVVCLIGACIFYVSSHKKTGTLYSLNISKYYKDLSYSIMIVTKGEKIDNEDNPQIYMDSKEKSKKIFDYLNKFELLEVSHKKAIKKCNY